MTLKYFVTQMSLSVTAVPYILMLSALASCAPKLFAVSNLYSASLSPKEHVVVQLRCTARHTKCTK